jgi:hypothetical protein
MAKVADVKLGWTRSPSADVKKVTVVVTNDGAETTTEVGPEVESIQIVVSASKAFSFKVVVTDADGLVATSETYSFTMGDLETPVAPINLFHETVAVRDVA